MAKIFNSVLLTRTRLYLVYSLVFFVCIGFACDGSQSRTDISIVHENEQAVALFIPSNLIPGLQDTNAGAELRIVLHGQTEAMLGEYTHDNYGVLFRPLIPLVPGLNYEVFYRASRIGKVSIPGKKTSAVIKLEGIYPSADTLPENLLKIYLQFSQAMRQGVSGNYLAMLDAKGDTLRDIFLNLNAELWDQEGKQLTIWLDPGRIKRGLQPNEKDGNPLHTGQMYTMIVSGKWPDLKGHALKRDYSKKFIAKGKDISSPDPSSWTMNIPAAGSRQALSLDFHEALDRSLLYNSISIIRRDGQLISGKIFVRNQERGLLFYPEQHWAKGTYYLKTDTRLEDLAGNNVNRLFDRDLLQGKPAGSDAYFTRQFVIE